MEEMVEVEYSSYITLIKKTIKLKIEGFKVYIDSRICHVFEMSIITSCQSEIEPNILYYKIIGDDNLDKPEKLIFKTKIRLQNFITKLEKAQLDYSNFKKKYYSAGKENNLNESELISNSKNFHAFVIELYNQLNEISISKNLENILSYQENIINSIQQVSEKLHSHIQYLSTNLEVNNPEHEEVFMRYKQVYKLLIEMKEEIMKASFNINLSEIREYFKKTVLVFELLIQDFVKNFHYCKIELYNAISWTLSKEENDDSSPNDKLEEGDDSEEAALKNLILTNIKTQLELNAMEEQKESITSYLNDLLQSSN